MRVLKQFLKNLVLPIAVTLGFLSFAALSGFVAHLLGYQWVDGFIYVPGFVLILAAIGLLISIQWDIAKDQVKQKDNDVIRALKDE